MAESSSSVSAGKSAADRARVPDALRERPNPWLVVGLGWLLPGAGHALMGVSRKAAVFFFVLIGMAAIGLAFGGRLFPVQISEPLVLLASLAEWALLAPRVVAEMAGWGQGRVIDATYEYGNTFLIVAGLLNLLVVLDAFDRARGRKPS
jgi:hypothetical protein